MKRNLSESLLKELVRHNQINKYITEQDAPVEDTPEPVAGEAEPTTPQPTDATLGGVTPEPTTPTDQPGQPVDVENDPDVEVVTGEEGTDTTDTTGTGDTGTEEVDITELVTTQKDIQSKQEEYMNSMMSKLDDLEHKLGQMDGIFQKINQIEDKLEKYRTKTPEEKLELRSLDSYPFNQKLTDFFADKQEDMQKSGKNEYILKAEDVEDVDNRQIRKTFDQGLEY